MSIPITVFTPTYNRGYILNKCYESLNRQTNKNFIWLVIDDGSKDNTQELVHRWQQTDTGYEIRYIYKENGGLHTGYNTAIANMDTELSICIDSDDAMPPDAIEKILKIWSEIHDEETAGIIGLDFDSNGNLIGHLLPDEDRINPAKLLSDANIGDKKYVVRNDLLKEIAPMPVYPGEKNFNPHYLILCLSQKYRFKPVNECFCIVEYQADGMSNSIWQQYWNSPRSFAETRKLYLSLDGFGFCFRFRQSIHYVSSSIIAHNWKFLRESPAKRLTLLAIPFGFMLSILTFLKSRR